MKVFQRLNKIISDITRVNPGQIVFETEFRRDLDADELDIQKIICAVEEDLGVKIFDYCDEWHLGTVEELYFLTINYILKNNIKL